MWHKKRFEYHPKKIQVHCKICNVPMYLPKSKVKDYTTCSPKCRAIRKEKVNKTRERHCIICNATFVPRLNQITNGDGKCCSKKCVTKLMHKFSHTQESNKKRAESFKKAIEDGRYVVPTGKDHPKWMGGAKETIKRRIKSGKANESLKKYRKANPDKVREWAHTRHKRKIGRLPRGTVKLKMQLQNNLCVYCQKDVSITYHVDHIIPLAKGGTHVPDNIQILCPTCNVRKSAKLNFKLEVK